MTTHKRSDASTGGLKAPSVAHAETAARRVKRFQFAGIKVLIVEEIGPDDGGKTRKVFTHKTDGSPLTAAEKRLVKEQLPGIIGRRGSVEALRAHKSPSEPTDSPKRAPDRRGEKAKYYGGGKAKPKLYYLRQISKEQRVKPPATKGNVPLEGTTPGRARVETTGISGAKDEGLMQGPQTETANNAARSYTASARAETTQRPPRPLAPEERAAFLAHAAAHPWMGDRVTPASVHIATTFKTWLKNPGLRRSDIEAAQDNLLMAYDTEVRRDPSRKVKGLYVRPHKLAPGAKPALSMRPVWDLTQEELEIKRAAGREKIRRHRQKQKEARP